MIASRWMLLCCVGLGVVGFGIALPSAVSAASPSGPNVVLIMSDDQGIGDFGVMGNGIMETPHIDAMARRSAQMTTFYVSPVCAPTRACLMTGRYNYRTRVVDTWIGRAMMEPAEVTVAESLAAAGYATGIFGKWHLGDNYPMRAMDQGFHEALVHRGGGLGQPADPAENDNRYTDPILFHNGQQVETKGYCTDVYFDAAMNFMQQASEKKQPFFVYLATNAPHGPFHDVPEDLRKHYSTKDVASLAIRSRDLSKRGRKVLTAIAAMVTNIDDNVGRLFDKLDALGITDDTIVIYMVDNGPNTLRYVTKNFRGRKSDVHEGGIRSPLWVQWPGHLTAGHKNDTPVAHIDIMPTILAACGAKPPKDVKLDGRNFWPLLEGRQIDWPERSIVIQTHRGNQPVRFHHFMIRDARWKLLHPTGFGHEGFKEPPTFEKLELYDIVADPAETNNLAADHPEIVARLKDEYSRWFDDVSTTREDNYAPPRIHIGSEHENPLTLTRQDWRDGGWGPDSNGHWELHVATAGKYDIRLDFLAAENPGTATIEIAGVTKQIDTAAKQATVTFRGVELPAGPARLLATLASDGKGHGPLYVHIRKLEK